MKAITAIVKPFKLEDVKRALKEAGIAGLTVTEVQGVGRQGEHRDLSGRRISGRFRPQAAHRRDRRRRAAGAVVDAIVAAAATGKIGDGKVSSSPVEDLVRIRTGEQGRDAV